MSELTVRPVKRRWRNWLILLSIVAGLIACFVVYQRYLQRHYLTRLQAALLATDESDPHWRWGDMVAEYEKLPLSPHVPKLLGPWRGYLGWFGDDIGDRPGAIPYDRDGEHYNVRFPVPYFKILQERLLEPEATGLKVIREELKLLLEEPGISRVPFDDNILLNRMYYLSHYLLDEMELAAHQGNGEALIPLLQSQLQLSRYLRATPKAIDHLVGMGLQRRGCSGIKRALSLGTLSPSVLLQCQNMLQAEDQFHLLHILRSLRAEQFDDLEQARHDPIRRQKLKDSLLNFLPNSPTIADRFNYWWKWLEVESSLNSLPLAQAEILEYSNEVIALAKSKPESLVNIDPNQLPNHAPRRLESIKHPIARQFVGSNFKPTSAEMSTQSELRALIVALACERYRLAKGKWPDSLTDLKPDYLAAIPLDHYTGKELLYRKLPDGIVIYSVGINRVDDSGDVLSFGTSPKDRGVKLFNLEQRGKKYEELEPEKAKSE